ncbi:MAG: hypothetical protein WA937_15635 [Flavobacteriales bacterium]
MSDQGYKYKLPEILPTHRQTANWLVGLSTGALAGLFTLMEKVWPTEGIEAWSYALAGLFFILAICTGVAAHLFISAFTNCYEQHARADEELARAQAEYDKLPIGGDAQRKQDLQATIKSCTDDRRDFEQLKLAQHGWFKLFNRVLTATFYSGVLAGCVFLVSRAYSAKRLTTAGSVFLHDGRGMGASDGRYSVLLLNTENGLVYELRNDTVTGGTQWQLAHAHARSAYESAPHEAATKDTLPEPVKQGTVVSAGNKMDTTATPRPVAQD